MIGICGGVYRVGTYKCMYDVGGMAVGWVIILSLCATAEILFRLGLRKHSLHYVPSTHTPKKGTDSNAAAPPAGRRERNKKRK